MTDFFRFPHTPHLAWLGAGKPREDKVLDVAEAAALLAGDVVVEEKVDGANLGFSVDERGALRAQNRGKYLDLTALTGQWRPLRQWLGARHRSLAERLSPHLMFFGEWCYAVHSLRYSRLPDWFVGFDVYDRSTGVFWSVELRNALARELGVAVVPELGRGRFTLFSARSAARPLLADRGPRRRALRASRRRRQAPLPRQARAPEFVQGIDEHWSKRPLEANQLLPVAR